MKIIYRHKIDLRERSDLVRKYIADHRVDLKDLHGLKRWIARFRLEVAAWKYASRTAAGQHHDLRKLYSSR